MGKTKEKWNNILTLALGIALLPPLWAVLSPYIGVKTGSVALICAGLFAANGNEYSNAARICSGFILGDLWAVLALKIMDILQWNPNLELYIILFMLGGLAVIIACLLEKWVMLPAWLCGWAVGLTIMSPLGIDKISTLHIQIAVAMIAGVVYVGIGVDLFQKAILKLINK